MKQLIITITTVFVLISCNDYKAEKVNEKVAINYSDMDTITLGAGCFWCVEAIFEDIKGVESVVSGYANGTVKNPAYREVCTGRTGHAEVCQVVYDAELVPLAKILEVFWQVHDPTTLNRQGADVGTQYRSGIYYHNEAQKEVALSILKKLNTDKVFDNPIVTEIEGLRSFYPAEENHQDYFSLNGDQPYCRAVIQPKVEKFKKSFSEILK
jgi:peptide-methionine (S)-S-oxide reductase